MLRDFHLPLCVSRVDLMSLWIAKLTCLCPSKHRDILHKLAQAYAWLFLIGKRSSSSLAEPRVWDLCPCRTTSDLATTCAEVLCREMCRDMTMAATVHATARDAKEITFCMDLASHNFSRENSAWGDLLWRISGIVGEKTWHRDSS